MRLVEESRFIGVFRPTEQFYPDFILEAETSYFVRACADLTPEEQTDVKAHFVSVLNENKVSCQSYVSIKQSIRS